MSDSTVSSTLGAVVVSEYKGTEMPLEGNRLIVLYYKKTDKRDKLPTKCAQVPQIIVAVEPEALQSAVQDAINDMQDSMLRDMIEKSGKDYPQFSASEFTAEKLAEWAQAQAAGKKMDKQTISNWFDAHVQDALMKALSAVTSDADKLASAVKVHKEKFQMLAMPVPAIGQALAVQLQKAANLAADGPVKQAILSKLAPIASKSDTEFFGL